MIDFAWDIGRLHLSFATPADAPVSLTAVQVDGRSIAFGAVADVQPVVEIFLAAEGHGRSGQRRIDSTVGTRLRYDSHQLRADRAAVDADHHPDRREDGSASGAPAVAHQDIAVVRADVEVVNDGVGLLDLTGVSSIVIAPDGTGDAMRPDDVRLCWARSEWMAENRWVDEPVRERLLPDLGLTVPGHDAKAGMTLSSLGSWSTGNFLPTAVLHDTRTGVAIGWQVESSGGWTWEVGERWQGLYVLAQGPDEPGQQWRHRLEPGAAFRTVPAAVAFSDRGRDGAFGELTRHRRTTRRAHPDARDLPVVFNDYMNTLNGNPTTAVLLPLIRAAAGGRGRGVRRRRRLVLRRGVLVGHRR